MSEPVVLTEIDERGIATVTLNRPEVNNAYNGDMIQALLDNTAALAADDKVRVIVLRGNGRHFQAGADLKWINEVSARSPEDNLAVSQNARRLLRRRHRHHRRLRHRHRLDRRHLFHHRGALGPARGADPAAVGDRHWCSEPAPFRAQRRTFRCPAGLGIGAGARSLRTGRTG